MALHPETAITMADGQFIPAGDIEKGDEVLAFNTEERTIAPAKVTAVETVLHSKVISVRVTEEIACSEGQLFLMSDFTSKKAIELKPGDLVLKEDASATAIKSVRAVEKPAELIAIKTEKGYLSAEGVFVSE
ncbi:MAG: hypothetical protein KJ955_00900 [Nanoarchaeota archaeon]|nr:hypothetical protein [Nanoarchaeota archaeon]